MRSEPVGSWEHQQEQLRAQREATHAGAAETMYRAGRTRGSQGDIGQPPWMSHLHELFNLSDQMAGSLAAAHHYGQVEAYTEVAPHLIEDAYMPQAQRLAHQRDQAAERLGMAKTTMASAGMRAIGGRRTAVAGNIRRFRQAEAHYNGVNQQAQALHDEVTGHLDEVDRMRESLRYSPWQPQR